MKFKDLPGNHFAVRVKATSGSPFGARLGASGAAHVSHVAPTPATNVFELIMADTVATVTTSRPSDSVRLNRELGAGRSLLAQVHDLAPDGSVALEIVLFTGHTVELGPVDIGVDEQLRNQLADVAPTRAPGDALTWFAEHCTIRVGDDSYFVFTVGPALDEALEGRGACSVPNRLKGDTAAGLCVTGARYRVVATPALTQGRTVALAATWLANVNELRIGDGALRLAHGKLTIGEMAHTSPVTMQARTQLALLADYETSYLKRWDEFGVVEGEQFLTRAREFGAVRYTGGIDNRDGTVTVRIEDAPPFAVAALRSRSITELEPVDEVPAFVTDDAMSFEDFVKDLEQPGSSSKPAVPRRQYVAVKHFDDETSLLTLQVEHLPTHGTLILSTAGERAQILRRDSARRAVRSGRSANPQLGALLEEKGRITSFRSPQRIQPLTTFVREKVFRNPPTYRQVQAIDVALNTPDIAIIQGPPGTGKTTVVAAILERLNELEPKAGGPRRGRVLLTGFQHDAVENMIERISLNSLPVPKFGRRPEAGNDPNSFEQSLEEWAEKIARDLRSANPQVGELEDETAVKDLCEQYLRTPTRRLASILALRIGQVPVAVVGPDIATKAQTIARRLKADDHLAPSGTRLHKAALRIRVHPEGFADDGPERARDALVDLEALLNDEQTNLLTRAAGWTSARGVPPFLSALRQVRDDLLDRLAAPPVFRVEKPSDEIFDLAQRAIALIRSRGRGANDRKTAALADFLAELESNPQGIIDSVADYSFAFAATVQQSVSRTIREQKGLTGRDDDDGLEYEYVIVDEAARVSPRDLMIPMSQGKKIILVGDHRQLPHTIDDEVARAMDEDSDSDSETAWLRRSMFQYLFAERLRSLEERDGILRRVTLDTQFRMHPVLGDFISRNFYERFDHEERFTSGLPAEHFSHELQGTGGMPAVWIDVPADAGTQRREGTSWVRPSEADAIVDKLSEWISSPEGENLTYGVISFYKAQADRVRKLLLEHLDPAVANRIRVGTVDSFQGMEFDVVFLSVVRTMRLTEPTPGIDRARQARGAFGHLGLYNRLNVSMSRQQRLLVVVGDPALVTNDLAAEFIPGLVDFYRLANGHLDVGHAGSPPPSLTDEDGPPSDPGHAQQVPPNEPGKTTLGKILRVLGIGGR